MGRIYRDLREIPMPSDTKFNRRSKQVSNLAPVSRRAARTGRHWLERPLLPRQESQFQKQVCGSTEKRRNPVTRMGTYGVRMLKIFTP